MGAIYFPYALREIFSDAKSIRYIITKSVMCLLGWTFLASKQCKLLQSKDGGVKKIWLSRHQRMRERRGRHAQ